MTEKELKEYIEQKYGNIRAFALEIDIPCGLFLNVGL